MVSVASQLKDEVSAHAQSDGLKMRERSAPYFLGERKIFDGFDTESGFLVSYIPSVRKCVSHVQKALPFIVSMLKI